MARPKKRSGEGDFRKRLLALHRRFARGNLQVFNEIAKQLSSSLRSALVHHFGRKADDQAIEAGIDDALFEYFSDPARFDPSRNVPLEAFLAMAAQRNVAIFLRGEKRRRKREGEVIKQILISKKEGISVELELSAGNTMESEREIATQRISRLGPCAALQSNVRCGCSQ
jgi:hypothetical protein